MFDVIECFQSNSPARQTRIIILQTTDIAEARLQADKLWEGRGVKSVEEGTPRIPRTGVSSFIVVDRSSSQELYRVPES